MSISYLGPSMTTTNDCTFCKVAVLGTKSQTLAKLGLIISLHLGGGGLTSEEKEAAVPLKSCVLRRYAYWDQTGTEREVRCGLKES